MGWFGELVQRIEGERSIDYLVVGPLPVGNAAVQADPLVPDECYVELRVASLRIANSREFTSRLYGVVHAFTTLSREGSKDIEIASVTAPSKLFGVAATGAHNAVLVDKKVVGPVPWRGGTLDVEMGLFAVKYSDLAAPFIGLIGELASTAGVSFIAAAAPFIPVIKSGMQALAGSVGDAALEVGLTRTLVPMTGTYAVVAADKKGFAGKNLSVDPSDWRLLADGNAIDDASYLVFRVSKSDQRADFGAIPDLAAAYADLTAGIKAGKEDPARDALNLFARLAVTSPDLIPSDAARLVERVTTMFNSVFKGGRTARVSHLVPAALSDVPLYDRS